MPKYYDFKVAGYYLYFTSFCVIECMHVHASDLQLSDEERLRSYVDPLLNLGLIKKRGTGKGTTYFINPKLIANSKANVKTTLKNIEPYALKALILEDLKMHPQSLMSEIAERLPDVELRDLRNSVYKMVGKELASSGGRTYRRYELNDGRKEKK